MTESGPDRGSAGGTEVCSLVQAQGRGGTIRCPALAPAGEPEPGSGERQARPDIEDEMVAGRQDREHD